MPIGTLKILRHSGEIAPVQLVGEWSPGLIEQFPANKAIELILNTAYGWTGGDLSFLAELPCIKTLQIVGQKTLANLRLPPALESIHLAIVVTNPIQFDSCLTLKHASISWNSSTSSILKANSLESLLVSGFSESTLEGFSQLSCLRSLGIRLASSLSSLVGIENLTELLELELTQCRKLADISCIEKCLKLENLEIENCKKIAGYRSIGTLYSLQHLRIENCSDLEDLEFLQSNQVLRSLDLAGTNVLDGNFERMLGCSSLSKINFENRKHYSHTVRSWQKQKFPNAAWTSGF